MSSSLLAASSFSRRARAVARLATVLKDAGAFRNELMDVCHQHSVIEADVLGVELNPCVLRVRRSKHKIRNYQVTFKVSAPICDNEEDIEDIVISAAIVSCKLLDTSGGTPPSTPRHALRGATRSSAASSAEQ